MKNPSFPIHGMRMFAPPTSSIDAAVEAALAYAKHFGCKVQFEFNGIAVNVHPYSDRNKVIRSQEHRQWKKGGSVPA